MGSILCKFSFPHPPVQSQGQFYFLLNLQWGEINAFLFLMHHVTNTKNCCAAEKIYSLVLAVLVLRERQFLAKMRGAVVLL